jgi:hypothetical protein
VLLNSVVQSSQSCARLGVSSQSRVRASWCVIAESCEGLGASSQSCARLGASSQSHARVLVRHRSHARVLVRHRRVVSASWCVIAESCEGLGASFVMSLDRHVSVVGPLCEFECHYLCK